MRKRLFLFWLGLLFLSGCGLLPQPAPQRNIPTITPVVIVVTPTTAPSATPTALPPTATLAPSPTSKPKRLSSPTRTLAPTQVSQPEAAKPFKPQAGTWRTIPAFTHPDLGCQWAGIAGQVFDAEGKGVANLTVLLTGQVDGKSIDQVGGTADQSPYGPGGYELRLSDHLPAAGKGLMIQLFDAKGQALSDALPFQLPAACEQNLLLLNFQARSTGETAFLPMISNSH